MGLESIISPSALLLQGEEVPFEQKLIDLVDMNIFNMIIYASPYFRNMSLSSMK